MEQWERDFQVGRIVAGKTEYIISGSIINIVTPNREHRNEANRIYRDARRDAEIDGALLEDELLAILIQHDLWTMKDADEYEKLTKALEDLKVGLFEERFRSNAKLTIRQAIKKTREELSRLDMVRHGLDYLTVDGLAMSAKYRFLVSACMACDVNKDIYIDQIIDKLNQDRLTEQDYRELVRTEPWRSLWGVRESAGRGLFDLAAVDMSDEQRTIIVWSNIFDNIRQYPDAPGDSIFEDDDMLDGWMIIQKRKRESQQATAEANRIGNDKVRNSDEVYLMADTVDDAREIDKMNSVGAAMTKKQRMAFLKQKGEVNEVFMPDTAQRIQMELTQLESMKMRQTKGR